MITSRLGTKIIRLALVFLLLAAPASAGGQRMTDNKPVAEETTRTSYITIGAAQEEARDYRGAISSYSKALKDIPTSYRPHLHVKLSKLFELTGEATNALIHLTLAIKGNPRFFEARINRANLCLELNLINQALNDLTVAIGIDPSSAEAHFQRARVLLILNRVLDSYKEFSKAHQLDPRYPKPTLKNYQPGRKRNS